MSTLKYHRKGHFSQQILQKERYSPFSPHPCFLKSLFPCLACFALGWGFTFVNQEIQAHVASRLAGLGFQATPTPREQHEVSQHQGCHDSPTGKSEVSPLLAGQSSPSTRQGLAWSLFLEAVSLQGLCCSIYRLVLTAPQGEEMDSTLDVGKARGRFSAGANQNSFTGGQGAIPIHPKWKSVSERRKDRLQPLHGLRAALCTDVGHPSFPVHQCWKSHAMFFCSSQPSDAEDRSSEPTKGFLLPWVTKIHHLLFSTAAPSVFAALHLWPPEDASRHMMALTPSWLYPLTSAVGDKQIFTHTWDLGETL